MEGDVVVFDDKLRSNQNVIGLFFTRGRHKCQDLCSLFKHILIDQKELQKITETKRYCLNKR